jgi:hypothetical protein
MAILRSGVLVVLIAVAAASSSATAAPRVDLEIVTEKDFPALETQNWYQVFAELKLSVRIRASRSTDTVQVVTAGTKAAPVYRVTGMLTARNELVLPGGKFGIRDGGRIAAYIKEIQESGPPGSRKITAFGLTTEQFDVLRKDLARPVRFSTFDKTRAEVLEKIAADLGHEVALQSGVRDALKEAGEMVEDLQGVAYGTALACLLRPAGLGLTPRPASGKVRLEVRSGLAEKDAWPIGLSADAERRKYVPKLFEFLDVEVPKGTPMLDALAAVGEKLDAPILLDHNALAELGIELTKAKVTVPPSRLTPSMLLGKLLGAANPRLRFETRIDEADKPFLWVTIFRVK